MQKNYYKKYQKKTTNSRIPVYDETIDDIKGILYIKDILKNINKKTFKIKNIMHEAYFIPQTKMIDDLFKELQKTKSKWQ